MRGTVRCSRVAVAAASRWRCCLQRLQLQKLLNHELQLVQRAPEAELSQRHRWARGRGKGRGSVRGRDRGRGRASPGHRFRAKSILCAAMKRGKIKMECHGCRTRGERAALWPRRSRSRQRQRQRPTAPRHNRVHCGDASRRQRQRLPLGDWVGHTHRLWLRLRLGTGFNSVHCVRSFAAFVRALVRWCVHCLRVVRSFIWLALARSAWPPSLHHPTLLACACDCDSTSGPLGVPHSLTADTLWFAFGSARRTFVRLFGCPLPLPAACVSALFGVFHQHISCLSLSDENYVDDVGAALLLPLPDVDAQSLSRFVCLAVSVCALHVATSAFPLPAPSVDVDVGDN